MKNSLAKVFIFAVFILQGFVFPAGRGIESFAYQENRQYEIKPWHVGQFVIYKIITMENDGGDNRYKISIVGEENIEGQKYFWEQIDVWESVEEYGYNRIDKKLKKSISLKALVLPEETSSFENDPAGFISKGVFPAGAIKLSLRVGDGDWYDIKPESFLAGPDILSDTPYKATPHARGCINFSKLEVFEFPQIIDVPAGKIPCYHFSVCTRPNEKYWDEGFDLWRSGDIPVIGLVKMDFSITQYWQKRDFKKEKTSRGGILSFFKSLYGKRVVGRMRSDTCTMLLIDYGPR